MSKIAFILLCHKDPSAIIKQAQGLTAAGDYISIHFDARARPEEYRQLRDALDETPTSLSRKSASNAAGASGAWCKPA